MNPNRKGLYFFKKCNEFFIFKNMVILFSLFQIGCILNPGPQPLPMYPTANVDPTLAPFLARFLLEAKAYSLSFDVSHISIDYIDSLGVTGGENIVAECVNDPNHIELGGVIHVSSRFFKNPNYSEVYKERVLFHEFGHCILGRGHNTASVTSSDYYQMNASIMYPSVNNDNIYIDNREAYLNELFTGGIIAENYSYLGVGATTTAFPYSFYGSTGQ